jgi:hypothetical protein
MFKTRELEPGRITAATAAYDDDFTATAAYDGAGLDEGASETSIFACRIA